MARKNTTKPTLTANKSKTNAVSHFERRKALKEEKQKQKDPDVYEYAPSTDNRRRKRRENVGLELDRDEEMLGSDSDGGEDQTKPRLVGEEGIASDEDEEIDSDEAFEESDDDRFAGFFGSVAAADNKKAASRPKQQAEVDLNEDSDASEDAGNSDDEDGDPSEYIDVLDILDGRGEDLDDEEPSINNPPMDIDADADTEDSDDDGDEFHGISIDADSEEEPEDAIASLNTFVASLSSSSAKRKAEDAHADRPKKRRSVLKERTEAGAENEYHASSSRQQLRLDDLLDPLSPSASLKKSLKPLTSSKTATLSAPLQHRAQEKVDREAAYEQTKEEVDKWKTTMKRIQEAEHLSFPLQQDSSRLGKVSNLELAAKFKPSTEMESAVDALLKSAKLREEDILDTEDALLTQKLSVEEITERRNELRKMRELMFRAEIKAKRVKKIKSKMYRKMKRREKEKLDVGGDEDVDDESRTRQRAIERATLKHKNTGKWAKQMNARNKFDEDEEGGGSRKQMEEMLDRGERLRKKIVGEDSDDGSEIDDDGDDDDDEQVIRQRAFNELQVLDEDTPTELSAGKSKSNVFEMKFMKDAMARQQQEVDKDADDFVKELENAVLDAEDAEAEDASGVQVSRVGGRAVYRPGAENLQSHVSRRVMSTSPSVLDQPAESVSVPKVYSGLSLQQQPSETSNPWLAHNQDEQRQAIKAAPKKNAVVVSKDSKSADKSKHKLKKQQRGTAEDDTTVEINPDNVFTRDDSDNDVDEISHQEALLRSKGKGKDRTVFEQRDLVAKAFAADNVIRDFEAAKLQEMASDAPKTVDTTIPGWGAWGGSGAPKTKTRPQFMKQVPGLAPSARKDFNKSHVIISEKVDKKAKKYMVKDLPYPYTSKAQFERRMEQPLGTEWNTRTGFQRGTLPKVVKKMGTIIDPLEKMF